jgi:hypothetical protein
METYIKKMKTNNNESLRIIKPQEKSREVIKE